MGKDKERPKPKKIVPAQPAVVPVLKVPRRLAGISPDGVADDRRPVWRTSLLDLEYEGSWSWSDGSTSLARVLAFAAEQEKLTWREIRNMQTGGAQRRGPRNKFIPIEHLCKEAQKRLQELNLDDLDELFRFRDGNLGRLWGRMDADGGVLVFYPIWWDGRHQVCPSKDN